MAKRLLSKSQVLEEKLVGFNKWTLDYLIRCKRIPFFKEAGSRKIYFEEESLDKWIEENMVESMEVKSE